MHDVIIAYFNDRKHPGGFLEAVITNNLTEAVRRADTWNQVSLPNYIHWLWNCAPSKMWGNEQRFNDHIRGSEIKPLRDAWPGDRIVIPADELVYGTPESYGRVVSRDEECLWVVADDDPEQGEFPLSYEGHIMVG
jgi:hypothetical protein